MKDALMEYETLDAEQVDDLMARKKVRPPRDWHDTDAGGPPSGTAATPPKDQPIGGPAKEH